MKKEGIGKKFKKLRRSKYRLRITDAFTASGCRRFPKSGADRSGSEDDPAVHHFGNAGGADRCVVSGRMGIPSAGRDVPKYPASGSGEEDGQEKDELILAADALEDVNENMNFLKHQIRGNAVLRFLRQGKGDDGMDAECLNSGRVIPRLSGYGTSLLYGRLE